MNIMITKSSFYLCVLPSAYGNSETECEKCIFFKKSKFEVEYYYSTHFQPLLHFYTPEKHQKTGNFLMFSWNKEVEHWLKIA